MRLRSTNGLWCLAIVEPLRPGEPKEVALARLRASPGVVLVEEIEDPDIAGRAFVEPASGQPAEALAALLASCPDALPGNARLVWLDGPGGHLARHVADAALLREAERRHAARQKAEQEAQLAQAGLAFRRAIGSGGGSEPS